MDYVATRATHRPSGSREKKNKPALSAICNRLFFPYLLLIC